MLAIVAMVAAFAVTGPAFAHHGADHDRGRAERSSISRDQALEIARAQGVATAREVKLDDGNWKVEGHTENGREIEVEIDARTGDVVKRELY